MGPIDIARMLTEDPDIILIEAICPACRSPHAYHSPFQRHEKAWDCTNPNCVHYKEGQAKSSSGTKLEPETTSGSLTRPIHNINDFLKLDIKTREASMQDFVIMLNKTGNRISYGALGHLYQTFIKRRNMSIGQLGVLFASTMIKKIPSIILTTCRGSPDPKRLGTYHKKVIDRVDPADLADALKRPVITKDMAENAFREFLENMP